MLKSGTYSVNVNLGGDPIKDSPRSGVEFIAGAVDATSCSLDDQGQLTDGRGLHFSAQPELFLSLKIHPNIKSTPQYTLNNS